MAPLPDFKLAVAGPVSVRSAGTAKPVTLSEKVTVKSKAAFCAPVGSPVIATVGTIVSTGILDVTGEAVFPFPAVSVAALALTLTVTLPSEVALGVIVTT